MTIKILENYFQTTKENIILLDRAFLGLYAIFKFINNNFTKKKVIFTSNTCAAPVFSAIYAGLQPVFTDISLENYQMDVTETYNIINNDNSVVAIVYIYTYGYISDNVLILRELARNKGILFIEDIAQSFGAKLNNKKIGTLGDLSVISFGYSKQIDAGCGGALLLNNNKTVKKEIIYELSKIERKIVDTQLGIDYKNEFYSLRKEALKYNDKFLGYSNFLNKYKNLYFQKINVNWELVRERINRFIDNHEVEKRFEKAIIYNDKLKTISESFSLPNIYSNFSIYRYSFLVANYEESDKLSIFLRNNKINCSNLYIPVSRFFCDKGFNKSIKLAERVINLWVDDIANLEYIDKTINVIKNFYKNKII